MNTNQIFSWNRFAATMRKEFVENWRALALITAGLYLWYTISMIITNVTTLSGSYSANPLFFTLIAAIIAGSAFHGLKTRHGRVDMLGYPASTAEKYIVNLLLYVVGAFVIFAISFQLADITRYLVMCFINSKLGISSTLPNNLVTQFYFDTTYPLTKTEIAVTLIETLCAGALFFLGSVLWPRRSAIKTVLVLLAITIIKIVIAGIAYYQKFGGNNQMVPNHMNDYFWNQMMTVDIWFNVIFYSLCLVLAWLVLKRKDVITLKWWK